MKTYVVKSRGGADAPIRVEIQADDYSYHANGATLHFIADGRTVYVVGTAQLISIEVR